MKRRLHIVILLFGLAMLVGCEKLTSPRPSPRGEGGDSPAAVRHPLIPLTPLKGGDEGEACRTLEGIDNLMWQQPDSAFALLQTFATSPEADSLDGFDLHYFHLLLSELLYKNYCEQSNRTELLKAVGYFDSIVGSHGAVARGVSVWPSQRRDASYASAKTMAFLAARAHYINGVGYYERDSVVEACEEQMKARELAEELAEVDKTNRQYQWFMALVSTRLADLFSDMYLHEQAIYFAQLSLPYYQKSEEQSWYVSRMLCEIGIHYNMLNALDSADCYFQRALSALPDTNNLLYRDLIVCQAFLYYKSGGHSQTALELLYQTIEHAESEAEYLSRCMTLGEVYYRESQYDSAWKYLDKVYENTKNKDSKKQAAEWLVDISKTQGKESIILNYADYLIPFSNQEENQSEVKSQLTELYKDFGQKRQERSHQRIKERNTRWTIIVIGSLLVVISAVVCLYLKNKRSGKLLKAQIKEEKSSHETQQKALSGKLRKSNEELRELKKLIGRQKNSAQKTNHAPSFAEEPICRLIIERVNQGQFLSQMDCKIYKDYALNKEQLTELRKAVDGHFNQFTIRISTAYPVLTRLDLDYCCLYLLGLTDADISALMQRAYNTVNERNSKLRRIFGSEMPIGITLQTIANDKALI